MISKVMKRGLTTIPVEVRKALGMKPGDRLIYTVEGNVVRIRVHPGARSLSGILASDKGKGMSFDEIRKAAAKNARKRGVQRQ